MKGRWNLPGLSAGLGFLLLIFDSKLVLEGARTGLELCIRTVIPSLFPFLVISMVLTRSITGSSRFFRAAAGILGIPETAAPVLIPAFLGGYPVGASCVSDLYRAGHIGKGQAERLLAFCNNAGPAFLFGMVSGFFPGPGRIWLLWLIHVAAAVLTALSLPAVEEHGSGRKVSDETTGRDEILPSAMDAMGLICCWVILFRILTAFLDRWCLWLLPPWLQVLLTGALELTNGCYELMRLTGLDLRFVLCACMLAWGGVCVLMQTASVTRGLSLRCYLSGKVLQTGFSLLLSFSVISEKGWVLLCILPAIPMLFRKIQKRSGILKPIPV